MSAETTGSTPTSVTPANRRPDEWAFVPESMDACWQHAWDGDTDQERTESLERISAAIDWCFNPPDSDGAQESILIDALLSAAAFIASLPCRCDPVDPAWDGPCRRCMVLGRLGDKRSDR